MQDIIVRLAQESEALPIHDIVQRAFQRYVDEAGMESNAVDALNETLDDIIRDINEQMVFVAIEDGKIVATVRIAIEHQGKWAYLSRFGVDTSCINKGVGSEILKEVEKEIAKIGVEKIRLHTAANASRTVSFYYKNGFYVESVCRKKGYVRALLVKQLEERE